MPLLHRHLFHIVLSAIYNQDIEIYYEHERILNTILHSYNCYLFKTLKELPKRIF